MPLVLVQDLSTDFQSMPERSSPSRKHSQCALLAGDEYQDARSMDGAVTLELAVGLDGDLHFETLATQHC